MRVRVSKAPLKVAWARMARTFLLVWAAYWGAVLAFPGSPSGGSALGSASIQLGFVAAVAAAMYSFRPSRDESLRMANYRSADAGIGRAAWVGLAFGTIGTSLLLFDRIVIQGVRYGEGLAAARTSWQVGSEGRGGPSSVFSVLGYLLGGCHFAAAALVILRINGWLTLRQTLFLLACGALVLGSSAMNGGRSSLLLFPAICLPALCLNPRASAGKVLLSPYALVFGAIAFAYCIAVFASRAELGATLGGDYALEFLSYLNIEPSPWLESSSFPDAVWMCILAWAYLIHSFATTCFIAVEPTTQCVAIGAHPIAMLSKFGLVGFPDDGWFLAGRFPSLPGALFHQFGLLGLVVGSMVLGAVTSAALKAVARFPRSMIALGAFLLAAATVALSPELAAFDFLGFASVAVGFLVLAPFESSPRRPARQANNQ